MFLGKKVYIDMLTNEKGENGISREARRPLAVHYRMKGVPLDCVKLYAEQNNMTLFDVYDKLMTNESITFDLLTTKPAMKDTKDRRKISVKEFKRKVKFIGEVNIFPLPK
jgi:hypothetical protein